MTPAKRRGKRLTLGVMVVGLSMLLVLGIVHWDAVRDHVEAWHFQLTTMTKTIEPEPEPKLDHVFRIKLQSRDGFFQALATYAGCPVTFPPASLDWPAFSPPVIWGADGKAWKFAWWWTELRTLADAKRSLKENGYRLVEQRFPRRAYVVIRDEHAQAEGRLLYPITFEPAPVTPAE